MNIDIATTDSEIAACYPVMRELRPHIAADDFVARVRRQEQDGYRLVFVDDGEDVIAAAGFRLLENLAWGRFLYVDDLVTLPGRRSQGHGGRLLAWLKAYAASAGCGQLHLDSGMQRKDAHRFYLHAGMEATGLHFCGSVTAEA